MAAGATGHEGAATTQEADEPAVGGPMTLLPVRGDGVVVGEVRAWSASPTGLVVTGRVRTSPESVRALVGQRVWASTRTRVTDSLVVFEAVAQPVRDDEIDLSGVVRLAHEARRRVVRAATPTPLELVVEGSDLRLRTVDLSRDGCRVALPADGALPVGSTVGLLLDLGADGGEDVRARGEVLRIDEDRGEAVLRFVGLEREDSERLERAVLARLSTGGA